MKLLKMKLGNWLNMTLIPYAKWRGYKKKTTTDMVIDPVLNEIIIGCLLGDARVERQKPQWNARLCFEQGVINKLYLFHLFEIFSPFCGMDLPTYRVKFHKRTNKENYSYYFKTLSYPSFNYYHSLFYTNGSAVKSIPKNIGELLTPIGLAYWIMDDGGRGTDNSLIISTHGFTPTEVDLLIQVFKEKFKILVKKYPDTRRVNQFYLYIPKSQVPLVIALVEHHLHKSMRYKLGLT